MAKTSNFAFVVSGQVFKFKAELTVIHSTDGVNVYGELNTDGKTFEDLVSSDELAIGNLTAPFTFYKNLHGNFSASLLKKSDLVSLILKYDTDVRSNEPSVYCNIISSSSSKQFLFSLDVSKLTSGNGIEKFITETADFFSVKRIALLARNNTDQKTNHFIRKTSSAYLSDVLISDKLAVYQIIAHALFDLKNGHSALAKGLYTFTGVEHVDLVIASTLNAAKFEAKLNCGNITTENYTIENLYFGIKNNKGFELEAGGTFILQLDGDTIKFYLSGTLTTSSFTLSASTDFKIPLNDRLSFSDLGLSIGVLPTGISFGMTGRINTGNLSLFGGFVINPPKINLITAALSSTKGRISLKDILEEVADVSFTGIECLDVVALGDFGINYVSISNWGTEKPEKAEIFSRFNQSISDELKLETVENIQLSPLGTHSDQVILTDTATMRHYRIDGNGKVSLNCQVYICAQPTKIGRYDMPVGFFLCGTLEIFNIQARCLFLIDPGNSLIALVQISAIQIDGIFELAKSKKSLPIQPIQGGLAGALIKPDNDGPTLYINIQKEKKELTFYLSAYINILNLFEFDALVLLKDRNIYINLELEYCGFKVIFNLQGGYENFSKSGFKARLVFDTSGFTQMLNEAQESIRRAAKSVQTKIEDANRKLNEAQQQILNLTSQVNSHNAWIQQLVNKRSDTSWWRPDEKIAYSAQIFYYESLNVGIWVAIGVAYTALEIAKAALAIGGAVVSETLNAVANIIGAITQLFWINSFELGMEFTSTAKKIDARLELTVFGKNVSLHQELNIDDLLNSIENFVKGQLSSESDKVRTNIEQGTYRGIALDGTEFLLHSEMQNIAQNKKMYYELLEIQAQVDDFLFESNRVHFEAYGKESEDWQKSICDLTEIKLQNDVVKSQYVEAFDDEFISSVDEVISVVRQNQTRNGISDGFNQQMDDLSAILKAINNEKSISKDFKQKASLFARIDNWVEQNNNVKRTADFTRNLNITEANKSYADNLNRLLENHFSSNTNEYCENFKVAVAAAIYQFRNPGNTKRRK